MVYDFDNNNKLLSYATCNTCIWFEYCVDIEMVQTQVLKT